MGISEQEALARQLHAIHREAMGDVSGSPYQWEQISIEVREAWIQVAQFVEAREINKVNAVINLTQYEEPDHK